MGTWKTAIAATVFVSTGLVAGDAGASNCVPGAQTQCACPGGGTGVQICSDDGSRLGACSNCTMMQQPMMQPMQPMYMPPPHVEMRRASQGLWVAGLATMLGGVVLVPIGAALVVGGVVDDSCDKHAAALCAGGSVAIGVGLIALASGIVMMAIGGTRVPVNGPPSQAWWVPAPRASGLAWSF
jgi:hypothetical protein